MTAINIITRRDALFAIAAVVLGPHVQAVESFGTFLLPVPTRPWANDDTTWSELAACLAEWQAHASPSQTPGQPDEPSGRAAFNDRVTLAWGQPDDRRPVGRHVLGRGWSDDRSTWVAFVDAPKADVLRAVAETKPAGDAAETTARKPRSGAL